MPRSHTKIRFLPLLTIIAPLFALGACSIPTEPDGIHQEPMTNIGIQLQQKGDDSGAADFYMRALQHKPDDLVALRNMATLLEAHGKLALAETYNASGLKYAPDDQGFQLTEGRLLIRLNRVDEARDLYQRMVGDDPHNVKAQNGLGVALDYLGQHEEAENHYRAALQDEPDNLVTLNNLGHSYVLAGKYDEAIALLEPHAANKTATPALRQNLAEAYGMAGMYVDAERLARIDLKPQDVKRNLAWYRARRAKLAPEPKFAADLGSYPTSDMAEAEADKIRAILGDAAGGITIASKPEVQAIGGTPSFALRATGFTSASSLNGFCQRLMKNGEECKRSGT